MCKEQNRQVQQEFFSQHRSFCGSDAHIDQITVPQINAVLPFSGIAPDFVSRRLSVVFGRISFSTLSPAGLGIRHRRQCRRERR